MYSLSDIAKIFHLEWDTRYEKVWALDKQDLLDIPSELGRFSFFPPSYLYWHLADEKLGKFPFILGQSRDTRNEASCHLRLNAILVDCVLAEQDLLNANSCPSACYQPISLTLESALTVHFILHGDFTTEVDYSVWSVDHEHMSTHFVVIKAIQENKGYAGVCQCLGYMGESSQVKPSFKIRDLTKTASVHWIRKKEQLNATVYGCLSDGYDFTLMRIDDDSQVGKIPSHVDGHWLHSID